MPKGATFHNQTLWGSIGWATPAAFGAAVAAPDRRVVLVTGEGSHQLTVQEISQFGRRGLRPIVFVLNNSGYLIERLLCKQPDIAYNDVAAWRYAEIAARPGLRRLVHRPGRPPAANSIGRYDPRSKAIRRLHRSHHRCLCRFAAFREAA